MCTKTKNTIYHRLNFQSVESSLPRHRGAVSAIGFDKSGEYIATCGVDGKVFVCGLYDASDNVLLQRHEPVSSVAIRPDYAAAGTATKQVVFAAGKSLLLQERRRMFGASQSLLLSQEHAVHDIQWRGTLLAWITDAALRLMDMSCRQIFGLVLADPSKQTPVTAVRPRLLWRHRDSLLACWYSSVKACAIRRRSELPAELSAGAALPKLQVAVQCYARIDACMLCGVAPFDAAADDQLLTLLCFDANADDARHRVQMKVVKIGWESYGEMSNDIIVMQDSDEVAADEVSLQNLTDERHCYILSSKDIIVAKPLDPDDRIDWLIGRGDYSKAMTVAAALPSKQSVTYVHPVHCTVYGSAVTVHCQTRRE